MHDLKRRPLTWLVAAALTGACGDNGNGSDDSGTGTPTTAPTTTTATPTTGPTPTSDPTTTAPTTSPTTDPTTGTTGTGDPTADPTGGTDTTTGGHAFVFDETPPEALVQIDRMGMPAVATAAISASVKDSYNASTPADDVAAKFLDDIVKNVVGLHGALDDDLMDAGLTPCAAMDCAQQAGPLVVPDTLQIDPGKPAGFPNGRTPADQVIDITLAVVLLDLTAHPIDVLAKLPLNPPKNDKEFLTEFPYLADPH